MSNSLKPKATILDLDAIMGTKIDAVETVPDYVTPPPGIYMLGVKDCKIKKFEMKDGTKAQRIAITYEIKETLDIKGDEPPYPNGSLFTDSFMGTEEGLKYFKKAAMNILRVSDFDGASMGDVMQGIIGTDFKARITVRKSKDDKGQVFENTQVRAADPLVAED